MYIKRHAKDAVSKLSKMFGAVLVSGPCQVVKLRCLKRVFLSISGHAHWGIP